MNVYKLRANIEGVNENSKYEFQGYHFALADDIEKDFDTFDWFKGQSMKEVMSRYNLVLHPNTDAPKDAKKGDLAQNWTSLTPFLSPKALSVIQPFLNEKDELYEFKTIDDDTYTVMYVLNTVDALDEENSTVKRFRTGRIMNVKKHVLKSEKIQDELIFRMPHDVSRVYVTQPFVDKVVEAGLTGFRFIPVWTDEGELPKEIRT